MGRGQSHHCHLLQGVQTRSYASWFCKATWFPFFDCLSGAPFWYRRVRFWPFAPTDTEWPHLELGTIAGLWRAICASWSLAIFFFKKIVCTGAIHSEERERVDWGWIVGEDEWEEGHEQDVKWISCSCGGGMWLGCGVCACGSRGWSQNLTELAAHQSG